MRRFPISAPYLVGFLGLLGVEVVIALFVHDQFIRPYIGDVLVVAVVYCLVRAVWRDASHLLPLWVFLFAAVVEVCQLFPILAVLGLEQHKVLRIILGSTFDLMDLLCYGAGCGFLFLWQLVERRFTRYQG